MLNEKEIRALRFYIGDVSGSDPFFSDPKAYVVLNSLFFPDISSERARAAEGKLLNPAIIADTERLTGFFSDPLIRIDQMPACLFGKDFSDGGFAAAGHADQHDILLLPQDLFINPVREVFRTGCAHKLFRRADRLGNQHIQAAFRRDSAAAGVQYEPAAKGVIDYVHHAFQVQERVQRERLRVRFRIHAAGSGVQDGFRVGMVLQRFLIGQAAVPAGAADFPDFPSTELLRREGRGAGGAAGTGDQHLFSGQIQANPADQADQAVQIRGG